MARFVGIRTLQGLVTLLGLIVLAFLAQFVIPGDPVRMLAPRTPTEEVAQRIRTQLGLDRPWWEQLGRYLIRVAQGDLGESYVRRQPVARLIVGRLPATAALALAGVLAQILLGFPIGIAMALSPRLRRWLSGLNLILLSLPTFVIGLSLLLALGFGLRLFPTAGGIGLRELILPALTLGLAGTPWYAGVIRDRLEESLGSPYVRMAVAKGLPNRWILIRHCLPHVFPAVATMAGMDFGVYLSGVVVVETIFGWPGIGLLAVQAMQTLDRPVVMGTVLVGGAAVVLLNGIVDILRMFLDPRARDGIG
ncbi:MAG: ABC transporter permease [Anaerolineae bacterium]|nr:ABC transporter permease [Anaerolineae bacterium]